MLSKFRAALAFIVAASGLSATAHAEPALWQVRDQDTTIYLFGTVHALPEGVDWYRGAVAEAFEGSDELVTEVSEADTSRISPTTLRIALLPKSQSLRGILSPGDRAALEEALARESVSPGGLDRYEPWYAAAALSMMPLMRDGGFTMGRGVEAVLYARAKALNRKAGALETVEYQLGVFDKLPLDVQTRYLRAVVDGLPTLRMDMTQMVEEWRQGHAERLAALMNAEEDDPRLMSALLTDRNRNWASWLKNRLAQPGKVFVAVGAGHLAGPGSVQEQLAALGVKAERVQ